MKSWRGVRKKSKMKLWGTECPRRNEEGDVVRK